MEAISNRIKRVLDEMHGKSDIRESYVIRKDGLIICSHVPSANSQKISAMSASLLELGKRTLKEVDGDNLKLIMVNGENINIIISGSGDIALVCAMGADENVGMIFIRIKMAIKKVQAILDEAYGN
ncbi:roadblock/LC7 domain-containing protein [Methanobacterium aggregans]|uniref:roadblock/LC7 domain-containing protein n=1 Tax=Methanobacterium aggregans TaxID=1615586 RepID=UPI001AE6028B|nr:roadblock/LC7 domain-containing protein [Methanobacterium aggregans]MBP2044878.1 putative regulator of Ras-like GTPase activity (Roadblock/LC7/MglB family) [Methanobacterium aggregans]